MFKKSTSRFETEIHKDAGLVQEILESANSVVDAPKDATGFFAHLDRHLADMSARKQYWMGV